MYKVIPTAHKPSVYAGLRRFIFVQRGTPNLIPLAKSPYLCGFAGKMNVIPQDLEGEMKTKIRAFKKASGEVKCQECGKIILEHELGNIQYVKTKRGTDLFFHTDCAEEVWKHGIV